MKRAGILLTLAALVAFCAAGVANAGPPEAVESFSATGTLYVDLPGETKKDGLVFSGSASLSSLSFGSGYVTFGTSSVNFSGDESEFTGASITGSVLVPEVSAPATVSVSGTAVDSSNPARSGSFTISNVELGKEFADSYLDISAGSGISLSGTASATATAYHTSADVQETVSAAQTVTSVDAVNGVITGSASGTIYWQSLSSEAAAPSPGGYRFAGVGPGAGLLLLALSGAALVAMIWRPRLSAAGPAFA